MSSSSWEQVQTKRFTQLRLHRVSWTNINNYIRKNVFPLVSRHRKWVQNDVEHTPFIPAPIRSTNNLTGGTPNSKGAFYLCFIFYSRVLNTSLLLNGIWSLSPLTPASSIYFAKALLTLTLAVSREAWGAQSDRTLTLSVQCVASTETPKSLMPPRIDPDSTKEEIHSPGTRQLVQTSYHIISV